MVVRRITIGFGCTPRGALWAFLAALLMLPPMAGTDTATRTFYYPASSGAYNTLTARGNATFNQASGSVIRLIGDNSSGRVGVGTTSPDSRAKLYIAGNLNIEGCIFTPYSNGWKCNSP